MLKLTGRRVLIAVLGCLLAVGLLLAAAVGWAVWSAAQTPDWFTRQRAAAAQPAAVERAQRVEGYVTQQLTRVDQPGPVVGEVRTIELGVDEINAWLLNRLPAWIENQNAPWPPGVGLPTVTLEDGRAVVGVSIEALGPKVVTMAFDVAVRDDGQLSLRLAQVRTGRLPLPAAALVSSVEGLGEEAQQAAAQKLTRLLEGVSIEPIFNIDSRRRARLTGLELTDGRAVATVRIEAQP